jgi:hypothetical protein
MRLATSMSAPREKFLVYNNNQIDRGKICYHKKPQPRNNKTKFRNPLKP